MECCHREEDTTHESEPKSSRLRRRRRPQHGRKQVGRNLHDSAHHGKSKCIPRVHTSWDARSVPFHRSFSQSPATQPFLPGACSTRSISSGISHDPESAIHATCKRGWAPRRPDRKKQLEGRASSCPGPPTALQRLPFRPFHSLSRKTHFENGGPGRSPYSPNRSRRSVTLQFRMNVNRDRNPYPSLPGKRGQTPPRPPDRKKPLGGARFVVPGTAHRTPAPVHSPLAIPSLARRISKRETWKVPLLSKPVTTKRDPPV